MATSGTYTFALNRDQLIAAALRLTTRFASEDVIPADDIANCAQALNVVCKEMATDGIPLWCTVTVPVTCVVGQAAYNLSSSSATKLPLRIVDGWVNTGASDVMMTQVSRSDYEAIGNKTASGVPNQYWYDPQLSGGIVTVYNVPDSAYKMKFAIQRQVQDVNLATENPDFPQEAYRLLKWALADEIALEYGTPQGVRMDIERRYAAYREKFFASIQERGSVIFTPSPLSYGSS